MSFNLFAAPTQDDIRVGYIDPTLGYVYGVSICEANEYAKNNPGTTFIFRDGDNNLRYLNINEVNRLTPNDLSATTDECGGIQQYKECGPPRIQFFGGDGVGAAGNPVIGRDGSLLAVDLITGGYGYQYPPIVAARDDCQFGNGAVLTAVLGETADETEVFEGEEDFEEYELCEDTDVGYGRRYGPNGEDLGPWEPQTYTRVGADPIQREIEIFQRALKKPFWTTRETQPDRVFTVEKSYATQDTTPVTFPDWGEFMNQYAVSPVKPSDVTGSDEAGRVFSMEWELNFPISGEYIFRGVCDNKAQVFIDGNLVGDLKGFKDNPSPLQKTIQEGNHIVKVDLLNIDLELEKPTTTTTTPTPTPTTTNVTSDLKAKFVKQGSSFYLQVDGSGSGEINFVMDVDDKYYVAGLAAKEVIIPSDGGKVRFTRKGKTGFGQFVDIPISSTVPQKETIKEKGKFSAGKKYGPIQIIGAGPNARGPFIKNPNRLGIRDADGDDENIKITIASIKGDTTTITTTSPSTAAEKTAEVTFKISKSASNTSSIEIVGLLTASGDDEITRKLEVGKVYQVIASPNNRKLRADGKVLQLEDSTDNDFNDLVIRATNGKFFDVNRNRCKFILENKNKNKIEVGEVISPKSWNQNPMGVSMIIDAPLPPVPQEQPPVQTGRCPPNPIWSTRFPGSNQKWYPVRFPSWSKFMNRYAISPILPLNTPGSDVSGSNFSNSWEIDLPYAGFYGVKGTRDNRGRILIDGKEVSSLDGFNVDNPKITKVYLSKGRHTIVAEVFNEPMETKTVIDTKIFSTQDWRVSFSPSSVQKTNIKFDVLVSGQYANSIEIEGLGVSLSKNFNAKEKRQSFSVEVEYGKVYNVKLSTSKQGTIKSRTKGDSFLQVEDATDFNWKDIQCSASQGKFFDLSGSTCKFILPAPPQLSGPTKITKNGVTYEGPELFGYKNKFWSKFMNDYSVSPKVFTSIDSPDDRVVGKYTMTWKGVNFPQDGLYKFNLQGDSVASLKVGGVKILTISDFQGGKVQYTFNVTKGTYDVVLEVDNLGDPTYLKTIGANPYIFSGNPMGVALFISKDIILNESNKTPWTSNPVGISAILIPPPCAKKIGGKGVIDKVIIEDPGNGYLPPLEQGPGYPVTLVLDEVIVEDPGINYRCGEDQLQITPNNGAQLSYECDSFGRITTVNVDNPGIGFNVYPTITMVSPPGSPTGPTGVNATFRPVFRVVRDPVQLIEEQKINQQVLIQVTDLVGLKQTGYVDGRAYYGAVYYDEGIPYAGYYKTAGLQTRVYATLQESITAQVTTPASAIQRSGTDVTSNDPRLNIPGTIEDTQT